MQISIEVNNDTITVSGPYSEENNTRWRSLGGKFRDNKWLMPDNDTSRQVVAELFGSKSEEVEVLIPMRQLPNGNIIQIGGYVLAQRRSRDSRINMPEGVSLAAGTFPPSGGSAKHPRVNASDDAVFRLRCRASFADKHNLLRATEKESTTPVIEV